MCPQEGRQTRQEAQLVQAGGEGQGVGVVESQREI